MKSNLVPFPILHQLRDEFFKKFSKIKVATKNSKEIKKEKAEGEKIKSVAQAKKWFKKIDSEVVRVSMNENKNIDENIDELEEEWGCEERYQNQRLPIH